MQVTKIEYRQLVLTMNTGFTTAHDTTVTRPLILIAVTIDDVTGYGEVQAFDNHEYAPQDQRAALAWLAKTIPTLVPWQGENLSDLIAQLPNDGQFARAGLEMALWDAVGKLTQTSLADMLGEHTDSVPVSIALGMTEQTEITSAIEQGYQRIKLKQSGMDLVQLTYIMARYPNQMFSLDFNASLSDMPENRQYLEALRDVGINLIEEPFRDATKQQYETLANKLLPMKISLDEQLNGLSDMQAWLTNTTVPAYTLKHGKLGGISVVLSAMQAIVDSGRLAWIGGMLASGLGRAVDTALASQLPQPQYPADISKQERYFTQDIVTADLTFENGQVKVPTEPGIGVTLDWDAIQQQQIGQTVTVNLLQKP